MSQQQIDGEEKSSPKNDYQLKEESELLSEDEDDEDYVPTNDNENNSEESEFGEEEDFVTDIISDKKDNESGENKTNDKIDENKLDKLWSEFCNDISIKKSETKTEKSNSQQISPEKVTLTKVYDFAGETVTIKETLDKKVVGQRHKEEVNKDCDSGTNSLFKQDPNVRPMTATKRSSGGISGLLSQLKKPKISTLKKSLHDWNEFKETNHFEEELDQHRRSKGSFLERQAFLSRTDLREFEREKSVRDRERKLRDLKQQNK